MRTFLMTFGLMVLILFAALSSDQTKREQVSSSAVDPAVQAASSPGSQNPIQINLMIHLDRPASSGTSPAEAVKDEVEAKQSDAPETALAAQPTKAAQALPAAPQEPPAPVVRVEAPTQVVIQEPLAAQVITQRQGCGCRYKGECMQTRAVPSTQVVYANTTSVRRCGLFRR
jgi:hypothetical protein